MDLLARYACIAFNAAGHMGALFQGVPNTWMAQAKNEATWAKLTSAWWKSNAIPPIKKQATQTIPVDSYR